MKTKLLIMLTLTFFISYAQNRSFNPVSGNFTGATPGQQFSGQEIFAFFVTKL